MGLFCRHGNLICLKKFQNLLRNKQTVIIVYSVILTQESSVNSDKFMTFQLLSYSVLHQPRYDNTHMLVIPSKVKHNKKKKKEKKNVDGSSTDLKPDTFSNFISSRCWAAFPGRNKLHN